MGAWGMGVSEKRRAPGSAVNTPSTMRSTLLRVESDDDTIESMTDTLVSTRKWLLLIHQVPPKPDYLRVKFRRRLQRLGAVPLKRTVYALPTGDQSREDFEWLARDIVAAGGEATVCEASFFDTQTDHRLDALAGRLAQPGSTMVPATEKPNGRVWVTRAAIYVDRIASAWLIRRFIDPAAQFRFVVPTDYQHQPGELRFDMYEGEFTHDGDRCTFETLCRHFNLRDRALTAIAEMVHDIDCKDDKFARAETPGLKVVVNGICRAHPDDEARLARGAAVLDDLYAQLSGART